MIRTRVVLLLAACMPARVAGAAAADDRPNIVFVLADDLGYGDFGAYGQKKIRTPRIDRLAREGMRFVEAYAGSTVCAPSRGALMTGKHTGHGFVRANRENGKGNAPGAIEGQLPLPKDTATVARVLKAAGYETALFGKWGLGGPNNDGDPNRQGFDEFFGYLCQRQAHSYYPEHLWRNGEMIRLDGNKHGVSPGKQYSHDLIAREALEFVKRPRARPFFLYVAFTIPHALLQAPADAMAEYRGAFPEIGDPGDGARPPNPAPRQAYAAMISRMDRDVGRLMGALRERRLDRRTLVIVSSDNGPAENGGVDAVEFFGSAGPLRGTKHDLYEGGIRVPFIARWPGHIKAGSVSRQTIAFWDVLPTLADLAGVKPPADIDGVSFLPTLLGEAGQKPHDFLYWEYHERGGAQAIRAGDWKAVRKGILTASPGDTELYDLAADLGETNDLASKHPEVVARLEQQMAAAHAPSREFPLPAEAAGAAPTSGMPASVFSGDLSWFRAPHGEWTMAGEAFSDPADGRKLAVRPGRGVVVNGAAGRTVHLSTAREHGDVEAHVEFMVPRGSNSGVYFQSRYEIQILDSYGVDRPKATDCGAVYARWNKDLKAPYEGAAPRVNASRPPGAWQSFDVVFRAPRFDAAGRKIENARFASVVHNGTLVARNVEVSGPTRAAPFEDEKPTGPLMLQGDHGPVAFRNIVLRPWRSPLVRP